jgi:hypothetical protein
MGRRMLSTPKTFGGSIEGRFAKPREARGETISGPNI